MQCILRTLLFVIVAAVFGGCGLARTAKLYSLGAMNVPETTGAYSKEVRVNASLVEHVPEYYLFFRTTLPQDDILTRFREHLERHGWNDRGLVTDAPGHTPFKTYLFERNGHDTQLRLTLTSHVNDGRPPDEVGVSVQLTELSWFEYNIIRPGDYFLARVLFFDSELGIFLTTIF